MEYKCELPKSIAEWKKPLLAKLQVNDSLHWDSNDSLKPIYRTEMFYVYLISNSGPFRIKTPHSYYSKTSAEPYGDLHYALADPRSRYYILHYR